MDATYFKRQHPDAEARASLYTYLIDCWDGTGGFSPPLDEIISTASQGNSNSLEDLPSWKETSYIDRFPREGYEKWKSRVRRAHYTNVMRTVGETICGFLLARTPTRDGLDDASEAFLADADGNGTPWDQLLRTEIARRLWLFGSLPILVDRSSEQAESAAEASPTYCSIMYPQSLFDWECDLSGELLWAKFVDTLSECEAADKDRVTFDRATIWTRNDWQRWRLDEGSTEPVLEASGTHPCGVVPVVLGGMSQPVSPTILGTSSAHEIGQESRKLYNYESLLDEHIYSQVYAVLAVVMPGLAKAEGFRLGTDNALTLPEGGSATYIAPPQSVAEVLFRAIDSCIRRVYRAAGLEFTLKDTGQPESGLSRQYQFAAMNRWLSGFAAELTRIEVETQRMVARWDGRDPDAVSDGMRISWPDDYDVRDLEAELRRGLDLLTLPIGETARKALIKTLRDDNIKLTDEEREASDREIDEASAAIAEAPEVSEPDPEAEAETEAEPETEPDTNPTGAGQPEEAPAVAAP